MSATIPYSFELAMAMPILNKWTDTYRMCNSHCEYDHKRRSNEFPFVRFDLRDQLWDRLPDNDTGDLESRVMERAYDDFNECYRSDWAEKDRGFRMTFDLNGYRLLCLVPTQSLWEERTEKEEEFQALQDEIDSGEATLAENSYDMECLKEEVEEIDKQLVECMKHLLVFEELVEHFKHWFDDYVVVFTDEEEPEFDFVDMDWFEEMKEENNWKLWSEHKLIADAAEETSVEAIHETMNEQIIIHAPGTTKEMQQIVWNTLVA